MSKYPLTDRVHKKYAYHLLSQHPKALSELRAEHRRVFTCDRERLPELIKDSPHLLNNLPYTTAVVNETLRLYPPLSVLRAGSEK